ncbi:MAG: FHA domain-containing protein [Pirellulales bacterium]
MLILDIRRRDGSVRKLWMRPGDLLRFGRSNQADVWIEGDESIHDLHFEISETEGLWHIRSLGHARVGINGNDGHLQRLKDGDLIIAGQTEVLVAIEGTGPKAVAPGHRYRNRQECIGHSMLSLLLSLPEPCRCECS